MKNSLKRSTVDVIRQMKESVSFRRYVRSENQKRKRMTKNEQSLREMWDQTFQHIQERIPGEEREKGAKRIFEETMVNLINLTKKKTKPSPNNYLNIKINELQVRILHT